MNKVTNQACFLLLIQDFLLHGCSRPAELATCMVGLLQVFTVGLWVSRPTHAYIFLQARINRAQINSSKESKSYEIRTLSLDATISPIDHSPDRFISTGASSVHTWTTTLARNPRDRNRESVSKIHNEH